MKVTLEDLEIAYARICGRPPLDKVKDRFKSEIEEILQAHGVFGEDEETAKLRFTDAERRFLRNRRGRT